jgi:hypothetical protein
MPSILNREEFLQKFNEGSEIIFNLTGVTFPSHVNPKQLRRDIISEISALTSPVGLTILREVENRFDKNGKALRIDVNGHSIERDDLTGLDVGYIPVRATVHFFDAEGTPYTYISEAFNSDIYDCDFEVSLINSGVTKIGPWVTVAISVR